MGKPTINLILIAAAWISMVASASAAPPERPPTVTKPKSGLAAVGGTISSGLKTGFEAISKPFESSSNNSEFDDPTRLSTKAKPSAGLYAAVARREEEKGRLDEAERQYKKALEISPKHLGSMLGYGRLLDRQGRAEEALQWYHRAIKEHPADPTPLNHLALCMASRGVTSQAAAVMEKAVHLDPKNPVYRNNMAVILVEAGNNEAAFRHLAAVHDEATAYYNLGYLLQKRGDSKAALAHFTMALRRNPQCHEARAWATHLEKTCAVANHEAAQVARRPDAGANGPTMPAQQPVAPAQTPVETRTLRQPPCPTEPVPQTSSRRFTTPWPRANSATPAASDSRRPIMDAGAVSAPPQQPAARPSDTTTAPLPKTEPLPATQPHGATNANVVYPLPPVDSASGRHW